MYQLAVSGDNRTRAVLYERVSCSRTRASRIPGRDKACFAPLSAAFRLMLSLRRVARLDSRFRGDDTRWRGASRCSSCCAASPQRGAAYELNHVGGLAIGRTEERPSFHGLCPSTTEIGTEISG